MYDNVEDDDDDDDDWEWVQKADEHFVRACAGKTHAKISQEPLYTEIYK